MYWSASAMDWMRSSCLIIATGFPYSINAIKAAVLGTERDTCVGAKTPGRMECDRAGLSLPISTAATRTSTTTAILPERLWWGGLSVRLAPNSLEMQPTLLARVGDVLKITDVHLCMQELFMSATRIETDSLGKVEVPLDALYGAQTTRAVANFPISGMRASGFLIQALGMVKRAAAEANQELGLITPEQGGAIVQAAQ